MTNDNEPRLKCETLQLGLVIACSDLTFTSFSALPEIERITFAMRAGLNRDGYGIAIEQLARLSRAFQEGRNVEFPIH